MCSKNTAWESLWSLVTRKCGTNPCAQTFSAWVEHDHPEMFPRPPPYLGAPLSLLKHRPPECSPHCRRPWCLDLFDVAERRPAPRRTAKSLPPPARWSSARGVFEQRPGPGHKGMPGRGQKERNGICKTPASASMQKEPNQSQHRAMESIRTQLYKYKCTGNC